jgi:hypothetical protein
MDGVRYDRFSEKKKSPVLPGGKREEEEERAGSLDMVFLYHLELGGRETLHHYLCPLTYGLGGGALEPRGGAVQDYP